MSCLLNYSSKSWISVSFSLSSPLCAQELLQMSSGWPISGSLTGCQGWGQTAWGNSLSFCCKSAWNLAFTSSRHRLPMFSFFTVTFLLGFWFELQFEAATHGDTFYLLENLITYLKIVSILCLVDLEAHNYLRWL